MHLLTSLAVHDRMRSEESNEQTAEAGDELAMLTGREILMEIDPGILIPSVIQGIAALSIGLPFFYSGFELVTMEPVQCTFHCKFLFLRMFLQPVVITTDCYFKLTVSFHEAPCIMKTCILDDYPDLL